MKVRVLLALLGALCGCGEHREPLTVGSKGTTEQNVLAEIVAQYLTARGIPAGRLSVAGGQAAHEALLAGQVDLYPESIGSAAMTILKLPPAEELGMLVERVKQEYRTRFGIEWMPPLGFAQRFAIVVRRDQNLERLSQAAERTAAWSLGMARGFAERADGLPALIRSYKLALRLAPGDTDPRRTYEALLAGNLDMVAGAATDGMLASPKLVMLADDLNAFAGYDTALILRGATLQAQPGLRAAIADLAGKFSDLAVREMNRQVDLEGRPPEQVAREFLRQSGLTR